MFVHMEHDDLEPADIEAGLVLHLRNLPFKVTREELEQIFEVNGFDGCIFYWPPTARNDPNINKGWCRVRFADRDAAERASVVLNGVALKGRLLEMRPVPLWGENPTQPTTPDASFAKPVPSPTGIALSSGVNMTPPDSPATQAAKVPLPSSPILAHGSPSAKTHTHQPSRLKRYPNSVFYDPRHRGRDIAAFMGIMRKIEANYQQDDIVSRPMVTTNARGKAVLRSQQFPGLPPDGDDSADKTTIWVTRVHQKAPQFEAIDVKELAKYQADGWVEWHPAARPTQKGSDYDDRKILRIEDVRSTDAPYKDTQDWFATAIETSRKRDGLAWEPGQLLENGKNRNKVKADISFSPGFIPAAETGRDLSSATSRGHIPILHRPAKVGAGWGDHDRFVEWQVHGRRVTKEMVPNKDWSFADGDTIEFVPASNSSAGTQGVSVKTKASCFISDEITASSPATLYQVMNRTNRQVPGRQGVRVADTQRHPRTRVQLGWE